MYPSHSNAPFLFSRSKEPGEIAVALAKKTASRLLVPSARALSEQDLARLFQADLDEYAEHYAAMECALNYAVQVALINGASSEEVKAIHDKLNAVPNPRESRANVLDGEGKGV